MTIEESKKIKSKHKKRLIIIIILIIICVIVYFRKVDFSKVNSIQSFGEQVSNNISPDSLEKKIVIGAATALTAAGGYEAYQIWRTPDGEEVPEGTKGAKATNDYNCDDFKTQSEAQNFFEKAGGVSNDTNRLDGNKDGVACQSLPKNN